MSVCVIGGRGRVGDGSVCCLCVCRTRWYACSHRTSWLRWLAYNGVVQEDA